MDYLDVYKDEKGFLLLGYEVFIIGLMNRENDGTRQEAGREGGRKEDDYNKRAIY